MTKRLKVFIGIVTGIVILLLALWQTLPRWLPRVLAHWLPQGSQLVLQGKPRWQQGALQLDGARFTAQDCLLAAVGPTRLTYRQGRWQLIGDKLSIDSACLSKLPAGDANSAPLALDKLQKQLPLLDVTINDFTVIPWQHYAGKLQLQASAGGQHLRYQGKNLSVEAVLDKHQQLTLNSVTLTPPNSPQPLHLTGKIAIPLDLDSLPAQGALQGEMQTGYLEKPLLLDMRWQQQQGVLTLTEKGDDKPLVTLPWEITPQQVSINQGEWRWPYSQQPLNGGLNVALHDWSKGLDETQISARLNVITAGHNGKGNAVLTLGPGKVGLIDSDLRFQLTGQANLADFSMTASIPGILSGTILNPTLVLQPGSLLRLWGNASPEMKLEEARLPLAGVKVTAGGITGRLQAIISASDSYWGRFKLHLDGKAQDFWPDHGNWQWRYWGKGQLPPLQAAWDVAGSGSWQDTTIVLDRLSTGFDKLKYGLVTVDAPRLSLGQPLRWQRGEQNPAFNADIQLVAGKVSFTDGGHLPAPVLALQLKGTTPDSFQWQGKLQAEQIGPIALHGRWDGERLRGEGWWPKQSLKVFQPLISPDLNIKLRDGEFYAQSAFSAARVQGFEAGGHWVVNNGGMWLKDGEMSGLDFVMSYRLKNHLWQLGAKGPVTLRIKSFSNLFEMQNITADLQGFYPYSEPAPLTLSNVGLDVLNGHISLSALRMPQHDAAVLKLDKVDLSALFTALKPKQLAMSGKVDGELPLYLNHPKWLVRNGWIANAGMLTLRLDKDMADAIGSNNLATGAAIDWLRYMEINRSRASVDLDNLGELTLKAHIDGLNPQKSAKREVILNYTHQENVFQLWRSLRFGDNLQEWLEQALSKPGEQP
ncbi:YdbH family protein [Serratia plymuthica]|uniref:Dicarboxylate transport n=1 Tax=Serratia plymuthica TaxID=82996 RepID=A0A2X4UN07_SERPL|nr:YdbH family protein [Serratia plymuthica]QPS20676.1 YdbH family protein [Serratia plymuthica]QPS62289.1 YdbH family protein [Serratia plymuthica]RKS65427.1 dicarboxylate transport [Serratia plymuthica]CAI2438507.1 Dicarboxylate transport [Serratia plymuthica]SQI41237.1 Dicarboxylate transport [Serratia plymuthica]